ncbi:hypothetical protein JHK86_039511 [Glycine max]|nr:hypothetical protein JHK86_039511 [Glycine max]
MSLRHGSKVWLEDRDSAWLAAEVLDSDGNRLLLVTDSGKKVYASPEKLLPRDADEEEHGGFEDMTRLAYLNEPGVLFNLRRRYALNDIYTYTGSILIAVNPFTKLPHLYDSHMMEQYKGAPLGELSPHVFAVADASYSGESGAGKTETTKLIMQYLTFVGGRAAGDERTVEQQVLESNPLLEAFGNARTVRNDNSSRFGKFVEIQFDSNGSISGAAIRTYLLERSRVVQLTDPERNYHCFYQLCACERDAEKYKLGHPSHFHYLNQSKVYELDGVSNAEEYLKTRRAMDIVGISYEDQEAIFRVLAAILHLGNIEFSPGKEHDSSVIKDEKSRFHMQMAADLFICDVDLLLATLCTRSIQTREGSIVKALDCNAAIAGRDALAKTHVFKMEQEEYGKEEINWSYIEFVDNQDVLDLIEKGVLEAVRISLAGYPTRRTYSEFVDRFGLIAPEFMDGRPHFSLISSQTSPCLSSFRSTSSQTSLLPLSSLVTVAIYSTDCAWLLWYLQRVALLSSASVSLLSNNYDDKAATEKILQKLKLENFQLGRTKVFLRAGQIGILDSRRAEVLDNAAKYIQRRLRTFIAHRDFILARAAAFSLQACCRGYIARKIYAAKRETAAAISIQKYIRMWLVRHAYFKLYFSAIIIQSHVRGFVTRQRLLHGKEHRAATFIQAYWRMSKVRSSFRRHQASIVAIQCLWRCRQAKRELRRLKQEANEAGALRLAKNKLEKQLEELTWRLHLEKKMRVSNEEAKKIEIFKLQKMLEALNLELDAAKLAKINECNKNAVLQNQFELSVKEKSALKRELVAVDELRKENALLKVSLGAFEKKCTTLELELMNAQKGRDETMEKLRESEQKCSQLEQNVKRLEEKLLSLEDENHVLRQKALSTPLLKSNRPSFAKSISEESPTPTKLIAPFTLGLSDSRRSKLTAERQQDNYEFLSKCIKENLGFKNGKPIAARIIYKCLLHWHSFESERTTIFDSIIEGINEVLKVREDDIILPYWLSNTSALLCLLQRNLRSNGFLTTTAQRYPGSSGLTSRAGHGPKSPLKFIGYDDGVLHVEARYPAILFKQQLTACVEKIFGLLRDNLKKELSPLLGSCIQAPKTGRGLHGGKSSRSPGGIPQQSSSGQWSNIVKFLDSLMGKLRQNHQYFAFCGAFSAVRRQSSGDPSPASPLLLRRECCTFSNGEYVKSGVAELEKWIVNATEEVIHQKRKKSLEEIRQDLCPAVISLIPSVHSTPAAYMNS